MKRFAKNIVVSILGWQLKRLLSKNNIKIVGVAGSIGKTSTKLSVASVLKNYIKVQVQDGNYNDIVTIPLVFFGVKNPPNLYNPFAWLNVFKSNEAIIKNAYDYDVVIVEIGTDGPGQIRKFSKLFKIDIGILSSIGHEHMQYFKDLNSVVKEELEFTKLCEKLIVNIDDVSREHLDNVRGYLTYGFSSKADCRVIVSGDKIELNYKNLNLKTKTKLLGSHLQKTLGAALLVANEIGIKIDNNFEKVLSDVTPIAGRMQQLNGINNSTLIDDTYNNVSSEPVIAALDVLYDMTRKNKIAVLGNMNELGKFSKEMHKKVGNYCDPKKLDLVITIGPDANGTLAETAKAKGCKVFKFDSPYEIAEFLKDKLDKDTVVLFKGSQNRVYLEEAVKLLLKNKLDSNKLVRQSNRWISLKNKQFNE